MNIVLLGGPGSGKGTLSNQLQEHYNYKAITPGALYRKEADLGTEFGLRAKAYWGNGGLCPDEMTNELIKNTLESLGPGSVVFDGYPRTVVQSAYLDSITKIDLVLDLQAEDEVVVQRLIKRKKIEGRVDDTKEGIKERLRLYHQNKQFIVDYYTNSANPLNHKERYTSLDANGTIPNTFNLAWAIILSKA